MQFHEDYNCVKKRHYNNLNIENQAGQAIFSFLKTKETKKNVIY